MSPMHSVIVLRSQAVVVAQGLRQGCVATPPFRVGIGNVVSDIHAVEPRRYLDELMRVLPYWPRERYLELAPQHWARTRARLNPNELAALVSRFTVPPLE